MQPKVQLKASVIPRSIMRATVLGDVMLNHGLPENVIKTVQQGFATGDVTGIAIYELDHASSVREQAMLTFAQMSRDDEVRIDVSNGRSMIEAVSRRFAHAVAASVQLIKRQGLGVDYTVFFRDDATMARHGYSPKTVGTSNRNLRRLFSVSPRSRPWHYVYTLLGVLVTGVVMGIKLLFRRTLAPLGVRRTNGVPQTHLRASLIATPPPSPAQRAEFRDVVARFAAYAEHEPDVTWAKYIDVLRVSLEIVEGDLDVAAKQLTTERARSRHLK